MIIQFYCCTRFRLQQEDIKNQNNDLSVYEIDIYCWCFELVDSGGELIPINDSISQYTLGKRGCLTPLAFDYRKLASKANYKSTISDKLALTKFEKGILTIDDNFSHDNYKPDSRLALVVTYANDSKDTLVYINNQTMFFANKGVMYYKNNIDSMLLDVGDKLQYSCD